MQYPQVSDDELRGIPIRITGFHVRTIRQSQAIEKAHKQRMIGATIAGARVPLGSQKMGMRREGISAFLNLLRRYAIYWSKMV